MTKHLVAQPEQCLQCLRPFAADNLVHGRCSTCRSRTPAAIWNMHHERAVAHHGVRLERSPLAFRLLPAEEAVRILADAQGAIDACDVHRVEQIGPRVILERAQDIQSGEQIMRLTMRIAATEEV